MKKIDRVLIGARNKDLETKINEANYFEELTNNGRTPEDIMSEVKTKLGIEENGSIIAEYQEKASVINKLQKNLVDVNGLTHRLLDDNVLEEQELNVLKNIETRLAVELAEIYGLELDELYLGEENE